VNCVEQQRFLRRETSVDRVTFSELPVLFLSPDISAFFFLIGIEGGGWWSQLSPIGTAPTIRPIVPAPGDYDDGKIGGMFGRGNRSTGRIPAPAPPVIGGSSF
jgi:hypothetical protein